ncbi:MAG TPA: SO_0444 family Cu/Zn efflux transporter [Candidatus Kapabacteria bacterium]|nr:SO_0444 family Cu/Zn efflux transporter [Candidatus Kapabacteria bacterium]
MEFLIILIQLFVEMSPYIMLGLVFAGLLNLLIKKETISKHLGKQDNSSIIKASLFGVPLPLCSCGVIPTSVYFAKSGASKGAVISFLTSTPQTGIDSIIATYGMMGPIFAAFRPFAALLMGIINGSLINKLFKQEEPTRTLFVEEYSTAENASSFKNKIIAFYKYSFVEFLDDIAPQFALGLLIAAAITYFIPDNFFSGSIIQDELPGMLAAILIGVPMYICATSAIPIAMSLIAKGFSPGVAFVFLAVGPATNAASFVILMKVLGRKVAFSYLLLLIITSIIFGYLLDYIFLALDVNPLSQLSSIHHHHSSVINSFYVIVSIVFFAFLSMSFYRLYIKKYFEKSKENKMIIIKVKGMNCNHCVSNVTKIIHSVAGTSKVEVNLATETAIIEGNPNLAEIKRLIEEAGYRVEME